MWKHEKNVRFRKLRTGKAQDSSSLGTPPQPETFRSISYNPIPKKTKRFAPNSIPRRFRDRTAVRVAFSANLVVQLSKSCVSKGLSRGQMVLQVAVVGHCLLRTKHFVQHF